MLTSLQNVLLLPGMSNQASAPTAWLNQLVTAADNAVKRYCKRDLELTNYVEYYDGYNLPDLYLNQPLVLGAVTSLVSSGTLPMSTINVASTANFDPGTGNNFGNLAVAVQTGINSWSTVYYTGVTSTSFTGCSGGSGTLYTGNANAGTVFAPIVWEDPEGYSGFNPAGFPDSSMLAIGTQFMPILDNQASYGTGYSGQVSNRGILQRIGGQGGSFTGWYPYNMGFGGKLASYRLPGWPFGKRNIKVNYSAGYCPGYVPPDLIDATTMLVAQMVRINPNGANISSESLGGYSYSVLMNGQDPELGDIRRRLAPYREISL